jgi:tetratricopeptide (TPR) repeat protein
MMQKMLPFPNRSILLLCIVLFCVTASFEASAENRPASTPLISDFEARLTLGRLLSYRSETLGEALSQYDILLREAPENVPLRVERAMVLVRLERLKEAGAEMDIALRENPEDPGVLAAAADLEATLGHASKSLALYET